MSNMMGQVIFVTCRESVEALLVIGILYSWMNRQEGAQQGKKYLIAGVLSGLLLAVFLALALVGVTRFFGDTGQAVFTAIMLAVAAALIVQMVLWMRQHARGLKRELEEGLRQSMMQGNLWGVFFLSMIAVAREGSETVVFLSGTFLGLKTANDFGVFFLAAAIGIALALVLFYLLQVGSRIISWPIFFRVTEIILLFLGCSLFMGAVNGFYNIAAAYDVPMWFYYFNGTAYDITHILDDATGFGSVLASVMAYRAHPAKIEVLAFVVYWVIVLGLLFIGSKKSQTQPKVVKTS